MEQDSSAPAGADRTIGRKLKAIRQSRRKSLRTIAQLAGISPGTLSKLENGKANLDSRQMIVALADALGVAPQDIVGLPIPAPGDPTADAAIGAVRAAVQAVTLGALDSGHAQPVEQLRDRVSDVLTAKQQCRHREVGEALPGLILDLHASIAAGKHVAELLRLAVYLHHSGTQAFLQGMGASADLSWTAARLAGEAAEHLDEVVPLGIAGFGQANGLLSWGSFGLARSVVDRAPVTVGDDPTLAGMLTLTQSLLATASSDTSGADAALREAAAIAEHTGEGNAHWLSFGPTGVSMWRLSNALEAGDHGGAAAFAEQIDPALLPPTRQANYWVNRARALARLRGRHGDAARSLHRAEVISPDKIYRNPLALDLLSGLVAKSKEDAVGRELRAMAYRAGLPV